ncbi:MAG: hypothetical protein JW760_02065, partial [Spirochaetales bacterium]|nr:hypothetical protein [Spirochaetales bacterium]
MGKKLFLRWFFVVLLFLPLIPVFSQDSASLEKTYKVLVLHPALEVGDWPNEFNTGLYKKISGQQEINIGIIFEYLGLELIPKGISEERIIEDLRNNAGLIQPDIVISVFPGVHSLIIAHGDEIFPEIPKIFVPTIGPQFEAINSLSDSYIIKSSSEFAMRQTLEHIVTLFP